MIYVDTSALVKLVVSEGESGAMKLISLDAMVTSALTGAELRRAVLRRKPELMVETEHILERLVTVSLDSSVLRAAGTLGPAALRTLDAIHLATALTVRDDLDALVSYDTRLLEAARLAGIPTASPGV
jgi:uncharacterized protein